MPVVISELAVVAVRRYCDRRIRPEIRDQMRLEVETRGKAITIVECRAPWREDMGPEWTKMRIAQFRFDPSTRAWSLFWANRNDRWLAYPDAEPSEDISDLIEALDSDVSGAFFG